jgi:hypothetical protein
MPKTRFWCALVLVVASPALLFAQRSRSGGGREGPTVGMGGMMEQDPVSFLIENSRELALSDSQVTKLMVVRRHLRMQNAGLMLRLDSARQAAGVKTGEERRADDQAERDRMQRVESALRPVRDSLSANNAAAREEALAALSEEQRARATELLAKMAKQRPEGGMRGRRPFDD